ncbi:unnamed protein product [Coregonus sp. 'balchen']|nr:unnamed protein product [Coregonus sp. 'balchen']
MYLNALTCVYEVRRQTLSSLKGYLASRVQVGFHDELKAEHASYLWQHPELCAMMADFLQFLLPRKPSDVFMFAHKDFFPFASHRPPGATFNTHTVPAS